MGGGGIGRGGFGGGDDCTCKWSKNTNVLKCSVITLFTLRFNAFQNIFDHTIVSVDIHVTKPVG